MKLTIQERLVLFTILPKQGNFSTMRAIHGLHMMLPLTTDERAASGYKEDGTKASWDIECETELSIDIEQTNVIVDTLRDLDRSKSLTADHLSLYEKFIASNVVPFSKEA